MTVFLVDARKSIQTKLNVRECNISYGHDSTQLVFCDSLEQALKLAANTYRPNKDVPVIQVQPLVGDTETSRMVWSPESLQNRENLVVYYCEETLGLRDGDDAINQLLFHIHSECESFAVTSPINIILQQRMELVSYSDSEAFSIEQLLADPKTSKIIKSLPAQSIATILSQFNEGDDDFTECLCGSAQPCSESSSGDHCKVFIKGYRAIEDLAARKPSGSKSLSLSHCTDKLFKWQSPCARVAGLQFLSSDLLSGYSSETNDRLIMSLITATISPLT